MANQATLTILRSADSTAEAALERARRFCEALAAGITRESAASTPAPAVSELGPQRTIGGFLIPILGMLRDTEREAAARAGLILVSTRTV